MKINKSELPNHAFIHCATEEEAKALFKEMEWTGNTLWDSNNSSYYPINSGKGWMQHPILTSSLEPIEFKDIVFPLNWFLSNLLGVAAGVPFRVNSICSLLQETYFIGTNDGVLRSISGDLANICLQVTLLLVIKNKDQIVCSPKWTEEEREDAKLVKRLGFATAHLADGQIVLTSNNGATFSTRSPILPNLTAEDGLVKLDEIIKKGDF